MQEYDFFLHDASLLQLFDSSKFTIEQINAGNMNFLFKLSDGEKTFLLKHAKPYLKMLGENFPLTQQRIIAEMNSMEYFHSLAPNYVPKIYLKNEKNFFFVMQYFQDYSPLQQTASSSFIYEKIGNFLSLLIQNPPLKKKSFTCDTLKQITKNYVFEFAFIQNHEALILFDYIPKQRFSKKILTNLAKLKTLFLHESKTLIHGDFHTDSIMIKKDDIAIIDSEFALFSDISFDIGNLLAHTLFHSIAKQDSSYKHKFLSLFFALQTKKNFRQILQNSIGFCAIEMIRRLYVPAKSKDLESINSIKEKQEAYKKSFETAKYLLEEYDSFSSLDKFLYELQTRL